MADTFATPDVSDQPDWLTTEDIAMRWGVSSATVRRIIREEGLPAFRPGGDRATYRVKVSDVTAYEAKHSQGPDAA